MPLLVICAPESHVEFLTPTLLISLEGEHDSHIQKPHDENLSSISEVFFYRARKDGTLKATLTKPISTIVASVRIFHSGFVISWVQKSLDPC